MKTAPLFIHRPEIGERQIGFTLALPYRVVRDWSPDVVLAMIDGYVGALIARLAALDKLPDEDGPIGEVPESWDQETECQGADPRNNLYALALLSTELASPSNPFLRSCVVDLFQEAVADERVKIGGKDDLLSAPIGRRRAGVWPVMEQMQGQIAAEIRVMLGEALLPQSLFDDAQRQRRIEAMQKCAAESTGDAERHESWMKMHVDAGWVYGEQFDPAHKTHPNLLPWDQLPANTRSKARIFDIVAKAAKQLADAAP